jgi:hypothetical protein
MINGTWQHIMDALRAAVRKQQAPSKAPTPRAASIASATERRHRRLFGETLSDTRPRLSSVNGMKQALISRQCTDPANVRIGKINTPQIGTRRRVLYNPGVAAIRGFG